MRVTENEMRAISKALNIWGWNNEVRVEQTNNSYEAALNGAPMTWGVNWSCKGTQNAEDAMKYAATLTKAAQIANALNALELVEDDDMTETLDGDDWFDICERIEENLEANPYFGITESAISGPIVKYRIG